MTRPAGFERGPLILLALLSLFAFGGPAVLLYVIRGGHEPAWPPDRPIEWITLVGLCLIVVILLGLCVAVSMPRLFAARPATDGKSRSEP